MLSFTVFIICAVTGLYFLVCGNLICGMLEFVLASMNFEPMVQWLSTLM